MKSKEVYGFVVRGGGEEIEEIHNSGGGGGGGGWEYVTDRIFKQNFFPAHPDSFAHKRIYIKVSAA